MPIPIGLATTTIIERGRGPQTYSVYAIETIQDEKQNLNIQNVGMYAIIAFTEHHQACITEPAFLSLQI